MARCENLVRFILNWETGVSDERMADEPLFEKAKKKWFKAHNKKAVTKKKWLPKISIKDIKFWVKTESDDLSNPEDLVASDDTKEATSQENKKQ